MERYWLFASAMVAYGGLAFLILGVLHGEREAAFAEQNRLGNHILELEAALPCSPTFELNCGIPEEGETGLYQDGANKVFRYALNGADLGPVRCFDKDGLEVLP
jgi:hypothetical protein